MKSEDGQSIHQKVKRQYEQYPYPDIDPTTDRPGLLVSGHLELMCDIVWAGKKPPEQLKVLDAGCGTGGPLVAMALQYPGTEMVGLDFSGASIEKARRLASRHNVKNVTFFQKSIEDVADLNQTFDFVVSSGVIHHLENPALGLRALGSVLDPQGVVSMMLYGKYGRIGVNMLQEAMRLLAPGLPSMDERIHMARHIARRVPSTHPFAPRLKGREINEGKASGIVDLLLHENDIPFDVPAIFQLCSDAGMRFHRWLFPSMYDPAQIIDDPEFIRVVKTLDQAEQYKVAELVSGNNPKHSFFAVRTEFQAPDINLENGNWRNLYCWLTPCMAWNRMSRDPQSDRFHVPCAVIQDTLKPYELEQWELLFLSRSSPGMPLGETVNLPDVRRAIPFADENQVDREVQNLLQRSLDALAVIMLKESKK
jgi:SAM-dependent methyltransferase